MGLMDVLTGMGGGTGMAGRGFGGGGMSPIVMAGLGLLAYKAVKGFGTQPASTANGAASPGSTSRGGLGDILGSLGLGGAGGPGPGGAAGLGGILSGGLGDLVRQFKNSGKGDVADSWVSTGENKQIAPQDLAKVLTPEQIEFLSQKTGMGRDELLAGLSQHLPQLVDTLTPQGRIPAPQEINQVV